MRIGPEGGALVVNSGNQEGLTMTVDPGVLTAWVDFRIRDILPGSLAPGGVSYSEPSPALPFRIEPEDLVLSSSVRLRLPYQPTAISGTGPGNVEINQVSPFTVRGYDPDMVDAVEGFVELDIKTFGQFQVVTGERVDPLDYVPPVGVITQLSNGFEFGVQDAAAQSEFASLATKEWRITGPAFDESVILNIYDVVGRRSESSDWLEVWGDAFRPFQTTGPGFVTPQTSVMQVQSPIGWPSIGASVLPFGFMSYELPRVYDGVLRRDVLKLALNVAYSRADLGTAERRMIYWFSPTAGLLQVSIDGTIYDRIP
ncbi:MAG: hypothetical protein ACI9SE_004824 [Neolewinella sp.]|jgi:hypothetical protein